jgi:hypothetical protein
MQKIIFSKINRNDFESIHTIINLFKEWKNCQFDMHRENDDFENKIIEDALKIIDILGERYNTKFWHPSEDELKTFNENYKKLSVKQKIEKAESHPWDFDSWIDAIANAEIILHELIEDGNNYIITLEQLSWPSGGIEAMENLIEIYDGQIIQNEMI